MYLCCNWQNWECEWRRYFCYYSVISCVLTFWFKASLFECDVHQACQTGWCLRVVVSKEVWRWAAQFKKYAKITFECMMVVRWMHLSRGWFYPRRSSTRAEFGEGWSRGWERWWGVMYCWNEFRSSFSLHYKSFCVAFLWSLYFYMFYWLQWWWWLIWKSKLVRCNNKYNNNSNNKNKNEIQFLILM